MKPLVFLDLDGPLVDVRPRYMAIHRDLVTGAGATPLSEEEYWALKRARVPEPRILQRCGVAEGASEDLARRRLARVESADLLELDRPWPWAATVIEQLAPLTTLVLVTQRAGGERLTDQLDRLGFEGAFADVLAGRGGRASTAKVERIQQSGWLDRSATALVGDTEVDVDSAHALGLAALWTRTGIRSDESIAPHLPDASLDDLRQLPAWLVEQSR